MDLGSLASTILTYPTGNPDRTFPHSSTYILVFNIRSKGELRLQPTKGTLWKHRISTHSHQLLLFHKEEQSNYLKGLWVILNLFGLMVDF